MFSAFNTFGKLGALASSIATPAPPSTDLTADDGSTTLYEDDGVTALTED